MTEQISLLGAAWEKPNTQGTDASQHIVPVQNAFEALQFMEGEDAGTPIKAHDMAAVPSLETDGLEEHNITKDG